MTELAGEAALVTGASRGIGRAVALELARLGADVCLVQRGDAADVAAEVEALGRRAVVVRADLSDPDSGEEAVRRSADALGRLDIAVCAAGRIQRQASLEADLDEWARVVAVNLTATFAVSRGAARVFAEARSRGRIVHVASVLAFQGGLGVSSYAASKGGVAQLTKALAVEWAPLGIRVNAVAPGYVDTEFTAALRADQARSAEITARIPAGRWATPEEIAAVVAMLVSPAASYVHGAVVPVDGGWLAR